MSLSLRGPKSIEEIVKDASNFDHSTSYPLRIALRTAQSMLNQAAHYERDGDLEAAYLFYYRYADFYFVQIAKHPDAKKIEYKPAVAKVRDEVIQDMAKMEALKPDLKRRYENYQESVRRRDAARRERLRDFVPDDDNSVASDAQFHDDSRLLNAGQHNDLALRLANKELRRRNGMRQDDDSTMDDLTQGIRAIGRQLDASKGNDVELDTPQTTRYNYPTVPHAAKSQTNGQPPLSPLSPTLPPKVTPGIATAHPPALPSKSPISTSATSGLPTLPPIEDISSSNYTFQTSAYTEGGLPLRTLFLPTELRTQFLSIALTNTRSNLETCGILCGTLISNAFFISRLVIPAQIATSDTCEVTEQGDIGLFDYVDGEGLTVCGWIHTHPSQTCFLSSRDLHTSVGYQVMLPESVAVVCAPSKTPDHGIFRLTDPSGKDAILSCHQPGIFHPHAQTNLYTDALRPGHVCELKGLQFEVVDLRDK
ncbi:hypothetical protein BDV97DRAFT_293142 [Delphinella strobiligena]|nr:hypothetical protein BDV97DRAFT_293142 [Delphinella strobiligena]